MLIAQNGNTLLHPRKPVLLFGAVRRTAEQRQKEGPMVRPDNWYFPQEFVNMMEVLAKRANMPNGAQYITRVLGQLMFKAYLDRNAKKPIVDSAEAIVQGSHLGTPTETKVKSLLGARQILQEWTHQIESAKDYVQIALYDFDNVDVAGGRPVDGADIHEYWYWQQTMLLKLLDKAREFKAQGGNRKVQVILDASKEEERNAYGYRKEYESGRQYQINNEGMVAYLRKLAQDEGLPIEVVHYPRELAKIYHVKLLVADGKKAIVGGMNLSNHSPANWDACVALEGPEVANLQAQTFHQDWVVARTIEKLSHGHSYREVRKQLKIIKPGDYAPFVRELPSNVKPVSNPGIRVLNTIPREYQAFGFTPREEIGDFLKDAIANPKLQEVLGEQFVFTHKGLTQKLIERYQQGSLQVRMLHSLGVVSKFPATRRAVHMLQDLGGENLLRYYKENKDTQEKLHAKLLLLKRKLSDGSPGWEVFIGSSNISKVGLETNVSEGRRNDYPNTDEVFQRGNREVALVIPSNALARPFVKQFGIDWNYSDVKKPNMLGSAETVAQYLPNVRSPENIPPDMLDQLLQQIEESIGLKKKNDGGRS